MTLPVLALPCQLADHNSGKESSPLSTTDTQGPVSPQLQSGTSISTTVMRFRENVNQCSNASPVPYPVTLTHAIVAEIDLTRIGFRSSDQGSLSAPHGPSAVNWSMKTIIWTDRGQVLHDNNKAETNCHPGYCASHLLTSLNTVLMILNDILYFVTCAFAYHPRHIQGLYLDHMFLYDS